MPSARRRQRQTKRKTPFELTQGQLNKMIDTLLHRHFRSNPDLIFLDGIAHTIIEGNLKQSLRKFAKYGVPALMKETERKKRRKRRRRRKATR